jgi:hypothetical protein
MAVSAGWLNGLLHLHLQSIEPVFYGSQLHLFLGVASSLDAKMIQFPAFPLVSECLAAR